jgi:hypothetical protein
MGVAPSLILKSSFEDIQSYIQNNDDTFLINTLPTGQQSCLIKNTVPYNDEERLLNAMINERMFDKCIIIYGLNTNDTTVYTKYNQIKSHGFSKVYLYLGGLFEWLCLQDIYGDENFPTTSRLIDIYKMRPHSSMNIKYIS